jgi:hypothetical protein
MTSNGREDESKRERKKSINKKQKKCQTDLKTVKDCCNNALRERQQNKKNYLFLSIPYMDISVAVLQLGQLGSERWQALSSSLARI